MATQWTAGTTSGQVLTAATLNTIGAAWVDYTPTLTQSATVTKTINYARYCQFQKTIIVQVHLTATGAGTAANEVLLGLPITSTTATARTIGTGFVFDASTTTLYNCSAILNSTTTAKFYYQAGFGWGFSPNIALANNDQITFTLIYEAA
jgi:hypothetical protein